MDDRELCRSVESAAGELVRRRTEELERERRAREGAEKDVERARRNQGRARAAGSGCVPVGCLGSVVGFVLIIPSCTGVSALSLATSNEALVGSLAIGLVAGLACLVVSRLGDGSLKSSQGRARDAGDVEALARRRLDDAHELQRKVTAAAGRLSAAQAGDEREAALAQIRRLKKEVDLELA